MYHGSFGAHKRFACSFNQMLARLCQNLNRYIVGNQFAFDKSADEIKLDFGSRREAHFYLFESDINEQLKHFQFLLKVHWCNERLVAVA